jgi:hypothetical protein
MKPKTLKNIFFLMLIGFIGTAVVDGFMKSKTMEGLVAWEKSKGPAKIIKDFRDSTVLSIKYKHAHSDNLCICTNIDLELKAYRSGLITIAAKDSVVARGVALGVDPDKSNIMYMRGESGEVLALAREEYPMGPDDILLVLRVTPINPDSQMFIPEKTITLFDRKAERDLPENCNN